MLFEELDKIKRDAVMMTIVLMFIGLLLLLIPEVYILFLEGTLGFTLLVAAALSVLLRSRRSPPCVHGTTCVCWNLRKVL